MTTMSPRGRALLIVGALGAVLCPAAARAQSDHTLTGSAELGGRGFFDRPGPLERAKFEEYRDMSPGPYLQSLRLQLLPGEHSLTSFELGAKDAFRRDQTFFGRATRPGLFDLRLGWDEIPHTYSTDARNWGGSLTSFTLPSPRPDTIAWKNIANTPYLDAVRTTWNVARADLSVTPGQFSDLKAEFTRIGKSGQRPMGMAFGSPGNNHREILEPIDQTVTDLRLSQSYARRRYQFQFSYDLNSFDNANTSVMADNPLVATNTATAGAATGRTALAPSNLAQTFSFAGGLRLPLRTRVNTALSYGLRSQNEPFVPMTINSAITDARQNYTVKSLNGDVRTLLANLTANSRPLRDVTLTARYRYWKFDDRTEEIQPAQMPIEIVDDRSVTVVTEPLNEAIPYSRHNASVELGWRASDLANLRAGLGFERWNREAVPGPRNVRRTSEFTPRVTLDLTPSDWLLLRGAVSRSRKWGSEYEDDVEFAGFMRFDQADRDVNRGDLLVQVTPIEQVTLSGTWARSKDTYPGSSYGVLGIDNTVLGGDVSWAPARRLNVYASYTREVYDLHQRSRYRESAMKDNTSFDWIGDDREWVETYGVGGTATLVPRKLELELHYDRSNGISALHAFNPTTPTGGTATQIANATAADYPDITHSWNPIRLFLRYSLNASWSGTVGYTHEAFDNNDFRTNGGAPYWAGRASTVTPTSDVLLGNDLLPYKASFLTVTIGFRPNLGRAMRPIL